MALSLPSPPKRTRPHLSEIQRAVFRKGSLRAVLSEAFLVQPHLHVGVHQQEVVLRNFGLTLRYFPLFKCAVIFASEVFTQSYPRARS